MRCILPALTGLVLLLAAPAGAGAWAREKGEVFLSFGANAVLFGQAARPVYYDPTLYLEYGLTDRMTLGLDGYTADKGTSGSVFGFVRVPIGPTDGAMRTALSFAAGGTLLPDATIEATPRVALHWGYGFDQGWLAADAQLTYGLDRNLWQSKIDLTLGYGISEDWTAGMIATLGTGLEGDIYAKVNPTILYHLTDRTSLRLGLVQALTGDRGSGVGLEAWVRF